MSDALYGVCSSSLPDGLVVGAREE
jgi:hypothetical protein